MYGNHDMDSNCNLWNTDSSHKTGAASSLYENKLLNTGKMPCNKKLIVLCIEGFNQHSHRRRRRRHQDNVSFLNTTDYLDHENHELYEDQSLKSMDED